MEKQTAMAVAAHFNLMAKNSQDLKKKLKAKGLSLGHDRETGYWIVYRDDPKAPIVSFK